MEFNRVQFLDIFNLRFKYFHFLLLLLHYIVEGNIVLFTALRLFDNFSH